MKVDVFILGAGPAGCCAALNIAPFYRTLMIDRHPLPSPRAGESLPPAANKLLRDMGLLDDFKGQGHLPYYGNQSRWGSEHLREIDFLRDPLGHGWHLNRQEFEVWLRKKAIERGAILLAPARLGRVEWNDHQGWRIVLVQANQRMEVQAHVLMDAGGRTPVIAKHLGANRIRLDNMVCGWVSGKSEINYSQQGFSYVHSVPQGWWYTAPTPGGKRIVAFHTCADSTATAWMHSAQSLLEQVEKIPQLSERIRFDLNDLQEWQHGYTAAHSAFTQPAVGSAWLTVGDAAICFDPLSSQGIFNALYTGLSASESVYRFLQGEISDFAEYQRQLDAIRDSYQWHLQEWYRSEMRWSEEEFWNRR